MTNYIYFVTYIENGVECCDTWSQKALDIELASGEVKIVRVELAYSIQKTLGLVKD